MILNRKYIIYPVMFVAVFAIATILSFSFLSDKFTLEMPDMVGRDLSEVQSMVEDVALLLVVNGESYDRQIPAGHVLKQSIKPGTVVKGLTQVDLVVSKGAEVRLIPSVTGLDMEAARTLLEEKGLDIIKVIEVHTRSVKQGTVLAQNPSPDKWTGQGMTLVVSKGVYDIIYYNPYFLGMQKVDALMLARDLGLSARISELDNSNVISYQFPDPGAEIMRGGVLRLRVGG